MSFRRGSETSSFYGIKVKSWSDSNLNRSSPWTQLDSPIRNFERNPVRKISSKDSKLCKSNKFGRNSNDWKREFFFSFGLLFFNSVMHRWWSSPAFRKEDNSREFNNKNTKLLEERSSMKKTSLRIIVDPGLH